MKTIYPSAAHHGQNIKRLREIMGVKQEAIAVELNITHQAMSKLEKKEQIEDEVLEEVSKILKVPIEAIKNFNDEAAVNVIANTFNDTFHQNSSFISYQPIFDPIEKIIELYERLLKMEQEKNALSKKEMSEEESL